MISWGSFQCLVYAPIIVIPAYILSSASYFSFCYCCYSRFCTLQPCDVRKCWPNFLPRLHTSGANDDDACCCHLFVFMDVFLKILHADSSVIVWSLFFLKTCSIAIQAALKVKRYKESESKQNLFLKLGIKLPMSFWEEI